MTDAEYRARCKDLAELLEPLDRYYARLRSRGAIGPAHSQVVAEWMPAGDENLDRLWKTAIKLQLSEDDRHDSGSRYHRLAQDDLQRLWKDLARRPALILSAQAQEFINETSRRLRCYAPANRSKRADGERGKRIVLGIILRFFRSGGKTGRPRTLHLKRKVSA